MKCPYCNEDYTTTSPCSCRTPLPAAVHPAPLHVAKGGDEEIPSTLVPTGLDNPFWKA